MINAMLRAALDCHDRGWSIIPIEPESKNAACKWAPFQQSRADVRQLSDWFCNGRYGIAVIHGEVSEGTAIRDFDHPGSYEAWAARVGSAARSLPTVRTPRGYHVYARIDVETVQNARMILGKNLASTGALPIGDGELRASSGCYSLVPPSKHPSGTQYDWIVPLGSGPIPLVDPVELGWLRCYTEDTDVLRATQENSSNKEGEHAPIRMTSEIKHAIMKSLPTGRGERHKQVFKFARALKAIAGIADQPAQAFRNVVREWHQLAKPHIVTQEFEETWIDFCNAWPRVEVPLGMGVLSGVSEKAFQHAPACTERYESKQVRFIVAVCFHLQRMRGDKPFFLSTRDAAAMVRDTLGGDASHVNTHRWLKLLVAEGILELVTVGNRQRASEFRYIGGE